MIPRTEYYYGGHPDPKVRWIKTGYPIKTGDTFSCILDGQVKHYKVTGRYHSLTEGMSLKLEPTPELQIESKI